MRLSLIVAAARNGVIGDQGQLPWRLSADLKRFKSLTMGHHLIMGRKTYDSLGRPLPGRVLIVLSRSAPPSQEIQTVDLSMPAADKPGSVVYLPDLEAALQLAAHDDEAFVIGGAEIFRELLPRADRLFLTWVEAEPPGDTWLPRIDWDAWQLTEETAVTADPKNEHATRFCIYDRKTSSS